MNSDATRESLSNHFPIFRFDLRPWLPPDWEEHVCDFAVIYGELSYLDGRSVTSRQHEFGMTADGLVGIAVGEIIALELPWLFKLYQTTILQLANELEIGRYTVASDLRSAINVNILPACSQYEWHIDSNPLTGLLFVTEHPLGTGGELVFRPDPLGRPTEDWELTVAPHAGDLLLFDAREAAHTVLPVPPPQRRLSVPMNYYLADVAYARPVDLDRYLYDDGTGHGERMSIA